MREIIHITKCDKCHKEITTDERAYAGIRWSNQVVEIPIKPLPDDVTMGDLCALCYIECVTAHINKIRKLHALPNLVPADE